MALHFVVGKAVDLHQLAYLLWRGNCTTTARVSEVEFVKFESNINTRTKCKENADTEKLKKDQSRPNFQATIGTAVEIEERVLLVGVIGV